MNWSTNFMSLNVQMTPSYLKGLKSVLAIFLNFKSNTN